MSSISTPAIMLRRMAYGDYDLICTFLTLNQGKVVLIAKSAKKSKKRFSGVLEPYGVLDIVYTGGRHRGLPVLQEAAVSKPFANIRSNVSKSAYAAFMAELINEHMEEKAVQKSVFHLYRYALELLDEEILTEETAGILFQMRFMAMSGFSPSLSECLSCGRKTEDLPRHPVFFDVKNGGVICCECRKAAAHLLPLSKGTIKQLLWLQRSSLSTAARIRFSPSALHESLSFLEAFVPFCLGKELKSLRFLQQLRASETRGGPKKQKPGG
ncbi:MAG: DNA repair protein RecO [Desulfobacterales bacterium]